MKTSEDAVNEALIHPVARVLILLAGTWLIGALHPIPETIYGLIMRRAEYGHEHWWEGALDWLDFEFVPVGSSMAGKTALISGPIAVFCFVCSALDRWDWKKTTALSGISTFFMLMLENWVPYDTGWIPQTSAFLAMMALTVMFFRPFRES